MGGHGGLNILPQKRWNGEQVAGQPLNNTGRKVTGTEEARDLRLMVQFMGLVAWPSVTSSNWPLAMSHTLLH